VTEGQGKEVKRISIDLPIDLVDGVDRLRKEWGFRARGLVFERLLEVILSNDLDDEIIENEQLDFNHNSNNDSSTPYIRIDNGNHEEKALVIVGNKNIEIKNVAVNDVKAKDVQSNKQDSVSTGIELPGFIRKQTTNLKRSLSKDKTFKNMEDTSITTINIDDLLKAKDAVEKHWIYLYGQRPTESVIEASMIWLARDIWPNVDGTENIPFTWNAACKMLNSYCSNWKIDSVTFDDVSYIGRRARRSFFS